MIEFDVDMSYLLECDELDKVVLNDECGEHEPMEFVPADATVGTCTDLASRLRKVTGLHAFAELFGFDWEDESDWDWHDVACAMADEVDATMGVGTCRAVVCNQSDCVHNREYRCACTDLEIQDQECLTYRCRYIDYDEEEE